MKGREFLAPARDDAAGHTAAHWRTAVVSAYYALMLECRDALKRWGRPVPPKQRVHADVRLILTFATDPDVKFLGFELDDLVQLRNTAHYDLLPHPAFRTRLAALDVIRRSTDAITMLDAIEADPGRLARAIASLKP